MRRRTCAALGFFLVTGLSLGCGSEPEPTMTVRFSSQALLSEADRVVVYFMDGSLACNDVLPTFPRPAPLVGPFEALLDDDSRTNGAVVRIEPIPVGRYVVLVDALDINQDLVGVGCLANQAIESGQTSEIEVTVMDA